MDKAKKTFSGKLLRAMRDRKKVTALTVATAVGVVRPTISSWESDNSEPRGSKLMELAEFFSADPSEFFE